VKSWKTTLIGVLAAIAILANEAMAFIDDDPSTIPSLDRLLEALALLGIGILARDNDKSSEDVGRYKDSG